MQVGGIVLLLVSEEEKRNHYIQIFHGVADAIFVLSARARKAPKRERGYTTTAYSDSDPFGTLGGKARVLAVAEVSHYFPETKIVTTTQGLDESGKLVIDAGLMAEELKHLGVPEERIIRETKSTNTLTELQEAVKLIATNNFSFSVILTSDYHIPRCKKMYERLAALSNPSDETFRRSLEKVKNENFGVVFAAAETILPLRSPHYATLIEKAHQTTEYAKRLNFEREGIAAIEKGTYTPREKNWRITSKRTKNAPQE